MSGSDEATETDEVTEAIGIAKSYVRRAFAAENIQNLGLEEVEWDEARDLWRITVGFSRPWDEAQRAPYGPLLFEKPPPRRDYKVVTVDLAKRKVTRVTNRSPT